MTNRPDKRNEQDLRSDALLTFYNEEKSGPGPKRARLNRAFLRMITHGFWNAGDRLPTDIEFTKMLPLSIATVQAGLKMLADQGIVVRKQRSGTVVASEEHLTRDVIFFKFTNAEGDGLAAARNLEITVEEVSDSGPWSAFLGDLPRYLCITRIFEVDGTFKVLSELHLADPRLRVLLDLPPDSIRDIAIRPLLHLRFGLPTIDLDWKVAFEQFNEDTARTLGVDTGCLGQLFTVGLWTINRTPLAFHRIWVPPNDRTMIISGDL